MDPLLLVTSITALVLFFYLLVALLNPEIFP